MSATDRLSVANLRIIHEPDPDKRPEDFDCSEEDIASFDRDEWHFLGISVAIDLIVCGTVQRIRTPGLWGIESHSSETYFREVAEEEYATLVDILSKLGVEQHLVPPLPATTVVCSACGEDTPAETAHMHQGAYIGDDCCWDERLRSSE